MARASSIKRVDALAIVLGTILIYTVVSLLNSRYHRHYNVK